VEGSPFTDTYHILLDSVPTGWVMVDVIEARDEIGQAEPDPRSITISPGDAFEPQVVTVQAVDDQQNEPVTHKVTFSHVSSSADLDFDDLIIPDIAVKVFDNESLPVGLDNPTLEVWEGGPVDSTRLVLLHPPSDPVHVALVSQLNQVELQPAQLTFTPADWNVPQTVTVRAIDDGQDETGSEENGEDVVYVYTQSDDALYRYWVGAIRGITVHDDDAPAVVITETDGTTDVAEWGATDTYRMALTVTPTAPLELSIVSGEHITTDKQSLVFTSGNYNVAQTVMVTAINDECTADNNDCFRGRHVRWIEHKITRSGPNYSGVAVDSVGVTVLDDDPHEHDHKSLMSYARQDDPRDTVASYAGPGQPLFDEWSNLQMAFHSALIHVGNSFSKGLGAAAATNPPEMTIADYVELYGHRPDVTAPTATVTWPISGAGVPLESDLTVAVGASDDTAIERVQVHFDLNGDGQLLGAEEVRATPLSAESFQATFTGVSGPTGVRSLRIIATDSSGNYVIQTVEVEVTPAGTNRRPVAEEQTITALRGLPVAVTLTGFDPDGDSLSFATLSQPTYGSLSGTPPQLVYTADNDYSGADAFTFTVNDGSADSTAATVSISVVGPAPVEARFTVPHSANVALAGGGARAVEASSGANPGQAIDGIPSRWATEAGATEQQWLTVALAHGQTHVVDHVVLDSTNARDFQVRVSTTGSEAADFTTVLSGTVPDEPGPHTFRFAPVQARYVQLVVVNRWGTLDLVAVGAFEVWTRSRQGGIISLSEGPPAGIADVSSVYGTGETYTPANAIDEDPRSYWAAPRTRMSGSQWNWGAAAPTL
jgi:hypothetical protein